LPFTTPRPSYLKKFFNLRIFHILSKLSFGLYLYHIPVIFVFEYTRESYREIFEMSPVIWNSIKIITLTTTIAVVYYLIVEKPVIVLESHLQRRTGKTEVKSKVFPHIEVASNLKDFDLVSLKPVL